MSSGAGPLLAAECEPLGQDPWPGRRRRRAGPRARPAARGRGRAARPWTSSCPGTGPCRCPRAGPSRPAIEDPRTGEALAVGILRVPGDGYRLRLVDFPAAFDRDALYDHPDDPWRFAVFCRAALAALQARRGRRWTCSTSRLAHGPRRPRAGAGQGGRRPDFAGMALMLTLHSLAYHGWTVAFDRLGQLGLEPGETAGRRQPGRDRPPAHRDRARRAREHGVAGAS